MWSWSVTWKFGYLNESLFHVTIETWQAILHWLYSQACDTFALIICITWFINWQTTFCSSFMLFVRCAYRDRQTLQSICVHFIHTSQHFINIYWYEPNVAVPPETAGAVLSTVGSISTSPRMGTGTRNKRTAGWRSDRRAANKKWRSEVCSSQQQWTSEPGNDG